MLMSGKQFKILNKKYNYLLQSQADSRAKNSVSGIEVDVMLKAVELRIKKKLDIVDKNNELRVKDQADSFNSEIKELRTVA